MAQSDSALTGRPRASVLPGPEAAKGHIAMFAFSAVVAGSFSLGALSAPSINPMALMAARFFFAALLTAAVVVAQGRARAEHFAAPWRYVILGGLYAIYFSLMFEGLKTAEPIATSAVFTLTPVLAAIAGWIVMRQVATRRMALALAVAAVGAIWVIFDADLGALAGLDIGRGEAIFFVGCIAHAFYAPMVPKLSRGEPLMVLTLGMLVGGFLCLAIVGGPAALATDWASLPAIVWITLAYISVVSGVISFILMNYAAVRLPSAKVMAYTYMTPVFVILWEGALGHGWPPLAVLAGIGAVLAGLFLLLKD